MLDLVFVERNGLTVFSSQSGNVSAWNFISELTCGTGIIMTKQLGMVLFFIRQAGFKVGRCEVIQPKTLNEITFTPVVLTMCDDDGFKVLAVKTETSLVEIDYCETV